MNYSNVDNSSEDQLICTYCSLLHTSYRLQATCSIKKSCRKSKGTIWI